VAAETSTTSAVKENASKRALQLQLVKEQQAQAWLEMYFAV
jgi:hypothetical protein